MIAIVETHAVYPPVNASVASLAVTAFFLEYIE